MSCQQRSFSPPASLSDSALPATPKRESPQAAGRVSRAAARRGCRGRRQWAATADMALRSHPKDAAAWAPCVEEAASRLCEGDAGPPRSKSASLSGGDWWGGGGLETAFPKHFERLFSSAWQTESPRILYERALGPGLCKPVLCEGSDKTRALGIRHSLLH